MYSRNFGFIKGPGCEIDNPFVEAVIGVVTLGLAGCLAYKLIKEDKSIKESLFGDDFKSSVDDVNNK